MPTNGPAQRTHTSFLALLALLVTLTSSLATALDVNDVRHMLHVRAGATCLRKDDLAAEIPRWLEDDVLASDVEIWVEGSYSNARNVLVRLARGGEVLARREFWPGPEGCAPLRAAVSLSIAMALRASVRDSEARPSAARAKVGPLDLVLGGVAALGLTRAVLAGPELRLQLALGRYFGVRTAGLGLLARDVPIRGAAVRFDAFVIGARLDACARAPIARPLEAHLCAGALGGVLRTGSDGAVVRHRDGLGWAAFTSTAGLTLATRHWLATVEPGLMVPLRPVRIGVVEARGGTTATQSLDTVAFTLGMGAGYRF